jgi:hypothetical protein
MNGRQLSFFIRTKRAVFPLAIVLSSAGLPFDDNYSGMEISLLSHAAEAFYERET